MAFRESLRRRMRGTLTTWWWGEGQMQDVSLLKKKSEKRCLGWIACRRGLGGGREWRVEKEKQGRGPLSPGI